MRFRDQLGRFIELPATPRRIVSLVPSQTELLFDLGLDEEVVGITKFCVRPTEQFRAKTRVGGTKQVHLDRVRELQPDLIIANKEENDKEQVETLAQEFPVWTSDVKNLSDALDMIRSLAEVVGKKEQGRSMCKSILQSFRDLDAGVIPARTAAYFVWRKPYMVAGADTFIHHMMERAGFQNIYADQARYPEVNLTDLAKKQPEVLLLPSEPFPFKEKHIEEFRIHCPEAAIQLVDGELFSWYGSRLLHAASYFLNLRVTIESTE